jgi:hypothetical protein
MGFSFSKLFGPGEPPLSATEKQVLTQLQANRKTALYQQVPDTMMTEFMTVIFSDRQLVHIIKKIFRSKQIADKQSFRGMYLDDLIRYSLMINRYSTRLILHHGVDPGIVAELMLKDINL